MRGGRHRARITLKSCCAVTPYGAPTSPLQAIRSLTQRDLPPGRINPISNAGYADPASKRLDGSWWAIFLAVRTYENQHYNTGRETFLLPVQWKDGWPIILGHGKAIPYVVPGPKVTEKGDQAPSSGNFTWRDEFDSPNLDPAWLQVRTPKQSWYGLRARPGSLPIYPRAVARSALDTTLRSWHAASNTWHSMRAQLSSCPRAVTR